MNKVQYDIISKVGDQFIFYHTVYIYMLDFKNSMAAAHMTLCYDMWTMDLMATNTEWKT